MGQVRIEPERQAIDDRAADSARLKAKALARWENEGGALQDDFADGRADFDLTGGQRARSRPAGRFTEAVAVFDSLAQLQRAIDVLLESGFDRADVSLLAAADAVDAAVGHVPMRQIEDSPKTPRGIYVSPEAMGAAEGGIIGTLAYLGGTATAAVIALAGGPITAIMVGGVLASGAGGLVGSGVAAIIGMRRAAYFDEQLARGGLLLWVRTWTAEQEERAVTVLRRSCGRDVHVHAFNAAQESDHGTGGARQA